MDRYKGREIQRDVDILRYGDIGRGSYRRYKDLDLQRLIDIESCIVIQRCTDIAVYRYRCVKEIEGIRGIKIRFTEI